MSKTLVAYFSASGVTAGAAREIAAAAGADLYEIRPREPYTDADLNWRDKQSRSTLEMTDPAARPAIAGGVADMRAYDTVFVGFPIWWGVEPRVVDTFLEGYDFSGKRMIPFATSGGSGIASGEERAGPLPRGKLGKGPAAARFRYGRLGQARAEPLTQGGSSRLQTGRRREGGGVDVPKGSEELTNARKEEIVSACAALYETMGFKDITLREIGEKTSFTRTSIYNYFQTKEEIFLALLQREYGAWTADLEAVRAGGVRPVGRGLRPPTGPHPGKAGAHAQADEHEPLRHGGQQPDGEPGGLQAGVCRCHGGADRLPGEVLSPHVGRRYPGVSLRFFPVPFRCLSLYLCHRQAGPGHGAGPGGISPLFHL